MTPVKKGSRQATPEDVQGLRASLESRLHALEDALANPAKHASLESLILDLARVATEEADATTRQAVLDAQRAAQNAIVAARTDAAAALEAEKSAAAPLREALDKAQAELKEERRKADASSREAAAVHRELDALRHTYEQDEASRAAMRRDLEAALAAVEAERSRASGLEESVERVRAEAQAARASIETQQREIAAKLQEFAGRHQALEQELKDERTAHAKTRSDHESARREADAAREEAEAARAERDAARTDLVAARAAADADRAAADAERTTANQLVDTSARLERDLEAARSELAGMRQQLEGFHRDADARTESLSQSQAEQDQLVRAVQEAARAAESRADEAVRDRHALLQELDAAKAAVRELDVLRHELHAAQDAIRERDAMRRELEAAQEAIRERDALRLELEAAHDARDAAGAPGMTLLRDLRSDDADEETVIDLTTDSRDGEWQRTMEGRIRSLELALRDAETRAESAELELEVQRRRDAPALAAVSDEPAPSDASQPKEPVFRGPARGAKRVLIKSQVDIQIDGTEGKLIDLSMTGAQVLTPFSMKPNRLVKITLPMDESLIACKAKVMWSRLEPKAGQLWYRAGVSFTSADQIALETFIRMHRKDG
jgi:hypothetical protein